MKLLNHPTCRPFTEAGNLSQLSAYYEEGRHIMWMLLRAAPRPCFNQALIEDIMTLAQAAKESSLRFDFWVTGSLVPNMFNVGGDLQFFADAIKNRKREAMMAYARACIDCVHAAARGFDTGAVSIAMVEGSALGAALKRRWRTISCWRRTMRAWGFRRSRSICFPAWAVTRWWRARRACAWPRS